MEPAVLGGWTLFFLLWGSVRSGVMRNLSAIKTGSWRSVNFFRAYRVFWNFAWTIADTMRFKELRVEPDWEFEGIEHFEALSNSHGAIILTAHMGSYDLGAHLFAESAGRRIFMVRAPEIDPQTRGFEEELQQRTGADGLRIDFNTKASDLALELLGALQDGELVAIQGDRVTPGISFMPATLFGRPTHLPSGPFALAMAARVPIYPLFILRAGPRRYRLLTCKPILVERISRGRDEDLQKAMQVWCEQLEGVIRQNWFQWFAFEPFAREQAA